MACCAPVQNRVRKPPAQAAALGAPPSAQPDEAAAAGEAAAHSSEPDGLELQQQQQGKERAGAEEAIESGAGEESEAAKAARIMAAYLAGESSPVTDLFLGQLQSSVTCHKCSTRFTMCAPSSPLSPRKGAHWGAQFP